MTITDPKGGDEKSPDPDAKNVQLKRTVLISGADEMNNFRLGSSDKSITFRQGK